LQSREMIGAIPCLPDRAADSREPPLLDPHAGAMRLGTQAWAQK
jgi:hypothetical protein